MSRRRCSKYVAFCAGCFWGPMLLAVDSDADGVDDDLDVCCDTPAGIEVDEYGRPIGDLDGDCDVDLDDFGLVQSNLTGPLLPGCCSDLDCNDGDPCTVDSCDRISATCLHHDIPDCAACTLVSACREELVCDVADLNAILVATDTHNLCFCVTDGEVVRITVIEEPGSGLNFTPNWRLLDFAGSAAIVCGAFTSATSQHCGPLPAAGSPYRVQVEDAGRNDVGSYRAHLQRLQAARACDELPLECDVPVSTTLDSVVDTDLLRLDVADGEIVRISVVRDPAAPAALNPEWRLIDGAGNPAQSCGVFAPVASLDCGPLRSALNPFRIELQDNGRNGAGLVHAGFQRLTAVRACENQPVACGVPVTTEIEHRLDSDLFSFRAADSELVRITVVEVVDPLDPNGPSFDPTWRLVDGTGATGGDVPCGSFSTTVGVICGPLWSTGNPYRIELNDSGQNDIGQLTLHFQRLAADKACNQFELSCNVAQLGSTDYATDSDLFLVNVPAGQTLRVTLIELPGGDAAYAPNWRLLDGLGNPAPVCGAFTTVATADCGPLPVSRNPYRIQVEDNGRADTGDFSLTVQFLPNGCPP